MQRNQIFFFYYENSNWWSIIWHHMRRFYKASYFSVFFFFLIFFFWESGVQFDSINFCILCDTSRFFLFFFINQNCIHSEKKSKLLQLGGLRITRFYFNNNKKTKLIYTQKKSCGIHVCQQEKTTQKVLSFDQIDMNLIFNTRK